MLTEHCQMRCVTEHKMLFGVTGKSNEKQSTKVVISMYSNRMC